MEIEPKDRCRAMVPSPGLWSRGHQCTRKNGHGPDGAYCAQHDPDAVKARREKSDADFRARLNERRPQFYGSKFLAVLEQIEAGHNDPLALAAEALTEYRKGLR